MKNEEVPVFDIICFSLIAIFVIFLIGCIVCIFRTGSYQYIDMDGNTGHSNKCYVNYGAMYCSVDGGKIMVKQYQEDK